MIEIKAPNTYTRSDSPVIFLGGSIEMDTAEKWQDRVVTALADMDVIILNPRRVNWDNTIEQSIDDPKFCEQVYWELDSLWESDLIIFYFDPNTRAPITLMELGLMANESNIIVCCPDGFWRKGNVEIVCERYGIPLMNTFDDMINTIKEELDRNDI